MRKPSVISETWEVRDPKDSKGGTLEEMPYSGERELVESSSSGGTGHQVERWGCHPTVKKALTQNCFYLKELQGKNMEKSLKKRRSSDKTKL